jgi:hypothetical protein
MQVSAKNIIAAYASFKSAALAGEMEADNPLGIQSAEIVESKVDNDPSTKDTLTATSWDGGFSSATDVYNFSEYSNNGKQVLDFNYQQAGFDAGDESGTVSLDAQSGEVLGVTGDAIQLKEESPISEPKPPPESKAIPDWIDTATLKETGGPVSFDGTQRVYLEDKNESQLNLSMTLMGDLSVTYLGENREPISHDPSPKEAGQLSDALKSLDDASNLAGYFQVLLGDRAAQ